MFLGVRSKKHIEFRLRNLLERDREGDGRIRKIFRRYIWIKLAQDRIQWRTSILKRRRFELYWKEINHLLDTEVDLVVDVSLQYS